MLGDAIEGARRRPTPWYLPPASVRVVGGGAYRRVGENLAGVLERDAALRPDARVLDVGCGSGRLAVALAQRLGPDGGYEGFDVVPEAVAWCQREISSRYPAFSFRHFDVGNPRYNRGGALDAGSLRFPYEDCSFDVAVAASVFTHMRSAETESYLAEIARVLRPAGQVLSTWYLLDANRERAVGPIGDAERWFPHALPSGERVVSARLPEYALALERSEVERMHADACLETKLVRYGSWLGMAGGTFQDVVIATPGQP